MQPSCPASHVRQHVGIVCVLSLVVGTAVAQTPPPERPSPGRWPEREYRWHYNQRNHPAWLSDDAARTLVIEAARSWAGCGVRMNFLGETEQAPGKMDGVNVVGWSLEMPPTLRAVTLGQARDGHLLERDIAIRPDRKEFERSPRLLQKVITHEFGHAIGLTHSSRCDDVMTLAADCAKANPDTLPLDLTANDLARCQALYPPPEPAAAGSPLLR